MARCLTHKFKVFIALFILVQALTWVVSHFIFTIPIQPDIIKNIGINFGVGLGAFLTIYCCYLWLLSTYKDTLNSTNAAMPITIGVIAALIALPFSMMLGIIGGGTFGGGYMSILFDWLGFNHRLGISLGVGVGIFIVAVLPTLLATIVGYSLGRALQKPMEAS